MAGSQRPSPLLSPGRCLNQGRLRDRIATADLRLSVLIDSAVTNNRDVMQASTDTGGVVYGAGRVQLEQRMLNELSESLAKVIKD